MSERQKLAQAMLEERCKSAGVKIHRTANEIDGVFLLKVRSSTINYGEQFRFDDPFGHDMSGLGYIESFLKGSYAAGTKGTPLPGAPPSPQGYRFVEAIDPADGMLYRYTGGMKVVGKMDASAPNVLIDLKRDPNFDLNIYAYVVDRIPVTTRAPRYGVTYDDISTREEREYWIAGSSLKVVDLQTNEVIAERVGYMRDTGMGNTSGGRSPWLWALDNACPAFLTREQRRRGPAFASTREGLNNSDQRPA